MRRSFVPALLLLLTAVAPACAHQSPDAAPSAQPEASQPEVEAEAEAETAELETAELDIVAVNDPNVISFEDDIAAGPVDSVVAPPKREDIPGFALFGTGESLEHDGPKLTLPDDAE